MHSKSNTMRLAVLLVALCCATCASAASLGFFFRAAAYVQNRPEAALCKLAVVDLASGECVVLPPAPEGTWAEWQVSEKDRCFYAWRWKADAKECLVLYRVSYQGKLERVKALTDIPRDQPMSEEGPTLNTSPGCKWVIVTSNRDKAFWAVNTETQVCRAIPYNNQDSDAIDQEVFGCTWISEDKLLLYCPKGMQAFSLSTLEKEIVYVKSPDAQEASGSMSPNGRQMIVQEYNDIRLHGKPWLARYFLLDMATHQSTPLVVQGCESAYFFSWSPTGKYIVESRPYPLRKNESIVIRSDRGEQIGEFKPPRQARLFFFSDLAGMDYLNAEGKIIQILEEANARFVVREVDWQTGASEERPFPTLPPGYVLSSCHGDVSAVPIDGGHKLICILLKEDKASGK